MMVNQDAVRLVEGSASSTRGAIPSTSVLDPSLTAGEPDHAPYAKIHNLCMTRERTLRGPIGRHATPKDGDENNADDPGGEGC
jgi:hypothetical protein